MAVGRLFGTDGIRGLANRELSPELALSVAAAAAHVLGCDDRDPAHRRTAVVGRDPRASGEMLEAAVCAGLAAAGVDVVKVGVLPTPAVAFLTAEYGADFGVVLSASHNPMPDNGIKLFAAGGLKLPDDVEADIEAVIASGAAGAAPARPTGAAIGRIRDAVDAGARYEKHLLAAVDRPLDGLRIVVDTAHGAASAIAPRVYRDAGADVVAIAAEPDGLNINDGVGSTHLDVLAAAVREHGADLGIAHDGDADRCLAVDATGAVVDGDQILAICALALHEQGRLHRDTVVATVMSNLGFHHAMREAGIDVVTTAVGDRYVLEALRADGLSLGGEQSGHVVFSEHATTGDGLLTALHLMARVAATARPLAELAAVVTRLPQTLLNVPVADKARVAASASVATVVDQVATELGDDGRILLRPSGTEQLVRVMVEAGSQDRADALAGRVAEVVASA